MDGLGRENGEHDLEHRKDGYGNISADAHVVKTVLRGIPRQIARDNAFNDLKVSARQKQKAKTHENGDEAKEGKACLVFYFHMFKTLSRTAVRRMDDYDLYTYYIVYNRREKKSSLKEKGAISCFPQLKYGEKCKDRVRKYTESLLTFWSAHGIMK